MSSAQVQGASASEKKLTKQGLANYERGREGVNKMLPGYQKVMNRDDTGRATGIAGADAMQTLGENTAGRTLAAGAGGGHSPTNLGNALTTTMNKATGGEMVRKDAMKTNYNDLGNQQNLGSVQSLASVAGNAYTVDRADADARQKESDAFLEAAGEVGGSLYYKNKLKKEAAEAEKKKIADHIRNKGNWGY